MSTPSPPVSPPPPKSLSAPQRRSDAEEVAEGDGDASPLPPPAASPSPTAAALLSPSTVDNSSNAIDKTDAEAEQDGLVGPPKKHTSQPSSPAALSGDEGATPSGAKFVYSASDNGRTSEKLRPAATKTLPARSSGSQEQQQAQAPPSAPSTLLPRHDSAVGDLSAQALPNTSVIPLSTDGMEMPYSEGARRVCLRLSVAQMVAGSVICVCSFATWRYPVIVGIAAVGFGAVGSQHYRSREAVRSSSCCCHPELYIAHQTNMQVSLAMSALLTFAVSIVASIFAPPELLGYAIVNALAALVLAVLSFSVALYNGQFQREVDWFHRESVV